MTVVIPLACTYCQSRGRASPAIFYGIGLRYRTARVQEHYAYYDCLHCSTYLAVVERFGYHRFKLNSQGMALVHKGMGRVTRRKQVRYGI